MKKTLVAMLVATLMALALPAPVRGQQADAEAKASASLQAERAWKKITKPASQLAKKFHGPSRVVVGGPTASASSSSSSSVTMVGRDHSREISAIQAEIAELKARPVPDPVALARLEGRLEGLDSRVVAIEATTLEHGSVLQNHEDRLVAVEKKKGCGFGCWFGRVLTHGGAFAAGYFLGDAGGGGSGSYGRTGGYR